jgi:hypothetical protein
MFHRATKRMLPVRGENPANGRALSLGLDLVAGPGFGSIRPRIKILEVLCWLCADEIAIGDNHDSILAVPRHVLRPIMKRPVDNVAEASLGILKLPRVHFAHSEPVAPSRKLAQGSRRRRPALDVPGQNLKLTHSSADPGWVLPGRVI